MKLDGALREPGAENKKCQARLIKPWLLFYILISLSSLHADWSSSPTTLDVPSPNAGTPASLVVDTLGNVTAAWLEYPLGGGTAAEAAYYSAASGTWSAPTILDAYSTAITQPHLVVDLVGNVTATWLEYISGSYVVQASRSDGIIWTLPATLNNGTQSPNAYPGIAPQMAVDTSGNVTVIWFEQQGSNYAVQAARFSGGSWTTSPTTLNGETPTAYQNIIPQMITDNLGNVTVVWIEQQGSNYAVQAARFSAGAWTSSPTTLDGETPNAFMNATPQMVVDTMGNVTVTWLENKDSSIVIEASRFSAGAWTAPLILDNETQSASSPAFLVVDTLGNVTASWIENLEIGTVIQAARYLTDSGFWTAPTLLETFGAAASIPRLIVDLSGNVTIVWMEYVGGYAVQASRFDGATWSSPITLDNGTQSPSSYLFSPIRLGVDLSGNVTVAWFEQPGSNYAVQAARFSEGAWTSSPATLDGGAPNAVINSPLQMIGDEFGNVTVVWVENLGDSLAVEAARFSEGAWTSAVILDNGTQVPAASLNTPLQMVVDNNGDATVTWLENSENPVAVQVNRFSGPPNLFPPANLTAHQEMRPLATRVEYINVLNWDAPATGETPASYRVYRDSELAGIVYYTGSQSFAFMDHNRPKGMQYTYCVYSVDIEGNISEPACVTIGCG